MVTDVRIPGLKMTVALADGYNVNPVSVDEFRIAVAETYDVIVEPGQSRGVQLLPRSGGSKTGYARNLAVREAIEGADTGDDPRPL